MVNKITVTQATIHFYRYVREVAQYGNILLIENQRTADSVLLLSAPAWQQEIEAMKNRRTYY